VWLAGADGVVSHASLVARTLICSGQRLRVGYVEAVASSAARRRQGHGTRVMCRINDLIRAQYALGVLSTGEHLFYERLGWERWRGRTLVDGPRGLEPTPDDDGGIMVLGTPQTPPLDLDGDIVADWRRGDVW
jgi:aminoglycoside 2'-N-acetyltransferase I